MSKRLTLQTAVAPAWPANPPLRTSPRKSPRKRKQPDIAEEPQPQSANNYGGAPRADGRQGGSRGRTGGNAEAGGAGARSSSPSPPPRSAAAAKGKAKVKSKTKSNAKGKSKSKSRPSLAAAVTSGGRFGASMSAAGASTAAVDDTDGVTDGAGPAEESGVVSPIAYQRKRSSTGGSNRKRSKSEAAQASKEFEDEQKEELRQIPEIAEQYDVMEVIGSGTFSTVFKVRINRAYQARERKKKKKPGDGKMHFRALKRIVFGCHPKRIEREIECLKRLEGKHHVVPITQVVRQKDSVVLVLKYFEHEPFQDYKDDLDLRQIAEYMQALFDALAHVHSHGIIHRDVKPTNFLYHRRHGKFLLVDFGLAQMAGKGGDDGAVLKPAKYRALSSGVRGRHTLGVRGYLSSREDKRRELIAARAGTRGFRAPEVLFKCVNQSPAIDIWSAGVILLSFLSGRSPFFLSNTDTDAIVELARTFGAKQLQEAARTFGKEMLIGRGCLKPGKDDRPFEEPMDLRKVCEGLRPADNPLDVDEVAYGFLRDCLTLDPMKRCSAQAALQHPFLVS